jgi:hypothetical protein
MVVPERNIRTLRSGAERPLTQIAPPPPHGASTPVVKESRPPAFCCCLVFRPKNMTVHGQIDVPLCHPNTPDVLLPLL